LPQQAKEKEELRKAQHERKCDFNETNAIFIQSKQNYFYHARIAVQMMLCLVEELL
jgi:hypothetical protein